MSKIKTILAVDDDRDILKVVDKILTAAGFKVVSAESPEEARRYLETDIPHLILSDLNMEPEDGYTFISSLRKQTRFTTIPIIVLSAVNEFNAVKRVISLGVSDYAIKPIVATLLVRKVKKALLNLEFTTWKAPEGQEPELKIAFESQMIALGETGYTLAGPFKIAAGEKMKIVSKDFSALGLDKTVQQASPRMRTYLAGGYFSNEVTFIGIGENESSKIRKFVRKG